MALRNLSPLIGIYEAVTFNGFVRLIDGDLVISGSYDSSLLDSGFKLVIASYFNEGELILIT